MFENRNIFSGKDLQGDVIRYREGVSIRYRERASIRYRALGEGVYEVQR